MDFRAILFDLDGLLVDSERESAEAMARVLTRDHGLPVSQELRDFVIGHSWNEIHERLVAEYGGALRWDMTELIERSSHEREVVIAEQGLTILPGAVEAVRRLGATRAVALVTGSSRAEAAQSLGVLGLVDAFRFVIASEDYAHGKPAPDGYLMAARTLDVAPAACLVLEDSTPGITAGRAAGMTVVAVRAGNFHGHDQSAAHRIVATLDEVTEGLLAELARAA